MPARRTALLAVSLFVLAGCGSSTISGGSKSTSRPSTASAQTSTMPPSETVQSTDGRFQTVIPAGFVNATNSVQSGVANVQYLAVGPRHHSFATNVNVVREPARGRSDMDQIVGLEIATIKRLAPQAGSFSKVTRLTLGGEPARAVDYLNAPTGNSVLHQRQVFVIHGGWIYTITYSALPSAYVAHVRALDAVTSAWRWLGSP
jgi:hypothetical protein